MFIANHRFILTSLALAMIASSSSRCSADLVLTAIYDGQSSSPKGVELYVGASGSYTGWTLDLEFNGGTSFTTAYTFDSTSYNEGDFLYVTSTSTDSVLTSTGGTIIADGSFNMNGDDRVRLTDGTNVIDQYGVSGTDGSGEDWEYTDSFATRISETTANGSFVIGDWNISAPNTLDPGNAPLTAALGSYSITAVPEPSAFLFGSLICGVLGFKNARKRNR